MSNEEFTTSGLSRRSVTKAAAWSMPVIAAAVAAPMASASPATTFDVTVAGSCVGGITIPLTDITAFGDPTFTITATTGAIPAGTIFNLSTGSLLSLGVISSSDLLTASLLDDGSIQLVTTGEIAEGSSVTVSVPVSDAAINADLLGNYTLSYVSAPAGFTEAGPGANSDSVSNTQATVLGQTVSICAA
ncbi:hypothetical protein [Zhihengliuella sp.]|uniref:hypothetical protein n=1 Tax=Zhihengliuella sp. TaxID=1954483 RepID=UPI002810D44A|nr:hypothetical protein [Zhihengliuella sp.]